MEELVFDNWENLPSLAECEGGELAELCRAILDSKKGERVAVIRVEGRSDITDYLVLCSALSNTHVKALADELEFRLGQRGLHPIHTDGGNGRNWQVLDYASVMVHVFDREARDFYNLDKLYREEKTEDEQ